MRKKLIADDWLSAREARELIFHFIRWGEHSYHYLRQLTNRSIEAELAMRGYDLSKQVSELQNNPYRCIAEFENLLAGGTYEITVSPGAKVTASLNVDGVEITRRDVEEHSVLRQAHSADFLAACNARDVAIQKLSFDNFYTSVSKGFSSIEAYFSLRVAVYNNHCKDPAKRLEEKRPKGGFVSLDEKIKDWLPIMTGVNLDISKSPGWADYKYLRKIRNDVVIHPKPDAGLSTLDELADGINRFRYGVGGLMFVLHQSFKEPAQSSIIRAMLYPTVRVVKSDIETP